MRSPDGGRTRFSSCRRHWRLPRKPSALIVGQVRRLACDGHRRRTRVHRKSQKGLVAALTRDFHGGPPAEQDMREVGLPAVEGGAEPGGSARCPQRRASRACCPQIPVLGPAGWSFLLRLELGRRTESGSGRGGGSWRRVSRRRGARLRDRVDRHFRARSGICRGARTDPGEKQPPGNHHGDTGGGAAPHTGRWGMEAAGSVACADGAAARRPAGSRARRSDIDEFVRLPT